MNRNAVTRSRDSGINLDGQAPKAFQRRGVDHRATANGGPAIGKSLATRPFWRMDRTYGSAPLACKTSIPALSSRSV